MENIIIIGGGPAGYTAAIYCARANLKPIVFEGDKSGGQLMLTTEIGNYPGFPEEIMGPELVNRFRAQAEKFGAKFISKNISKVDLQRGENKELTVWESDQKHEAKAVIIATGSEPRKLGLESETRLSAKGVSYCATCDGFFFQEKEICVIGGGDSALEEARFLTKFAKKVYVIHRRDELRASKIMQDRAKANQKIEFVWNSVVDEFLGEEKLEAVNLKNTKTGEITELKCQGAFVSIGHIPLTKLFEGQLELDQKNYIKTAPDSTKTNIKGVFAAGDVQDHAFKQAITAAGSGCMAAIEAEKFIEENF